MSIPSAAYNGCISKSDSEYWRRSANVRLLYRPVYRVVSPPPRLSPVQHRTQPDEHPSGDNTNKVAHGPWLRQPSVRFPNDIDISDEPQAPSSRTSAAQGGDAGAALRCSIDVRSRPAASSG